MSDHTVGGGGDKSRADGCEKAKRAEKEEKQERPRDRDSRVVVVGKGSAARDAAATEERNAAGVVEISWQGRAVPAVRDPHRLGLLLRVRRVFGGDGYTNLLLSSFV